MRRIQALGWVLAAGLALATAAEAQRPAPRLGVLGGINFATLGGEDVENAKNYTRFFGGVFAEVGLTDNIALRPEALYTMKGAKDEELGVTAKSKVSYIEIPVLLQFRVPPKTEGPWAVSPHFYVGPAIGFKASCKIELEGEETDCDDLDPDVTINSTDFSGIAGAGLAFGPVQVGVRYVYGFTKLVDDVAGEDDVKNRVFSVYAGVSFRLR